MSIDRIDFISSYCDRWCERCAFTDRCSAFACTVAIGMCGDVAAGIELPVGAPQPVGSDKPPAVGATLLADFVEPSPEELSKLTHEEEARHGRIDAMPLHSMAKTYARRAMEWLDKHRGIEITAGDLVMREALDIVAWDAFLVGAKLHCALSGRDRAQHDEHDYDDDPVQDDWNGSAKVALISLERSEAAWRLIGEATGDSQASILADAVGHLCRAVLDEYPHVTSFVRPGFDEPWRWERWRSRSRATTSSGWSGTWSPSWSPRRLWARGATSRAAQEPWPPARSIARRVE